MIIADQKPLKEIINVLQGYRKILIAGCGTCVTVCFAGGEKEVSILAAALRMAPELKDREVEIREQTVLRQCENEFIEQLKEQIDWSDVVLSMACGVGVQAVIEVFPQTLILPALNTKFMGRPPEQGVWSEYCSGCGNCLLDLTAGICPITRCAKNLLNGPCGGSQGGKCEVSPETACAWQLIYDRFKELNMSQRMDQIIPPKDWSTSAHGGTRRIVREDLKIVKGEK